MSNVVKQLQLGAEFDGAEYVPQRDKHRLTGQIQRVYDVMKDGQGRTLAEISRITGCPEASVSARLRDLRKEKFGSFTVTKEHLGGGLYIYQIPQEAGNEINTRH